MTDAIIINFPDRTSIDPDVVEGDSSICWSCETRPRSTNPFTCGMCEVCAKG